MRMKALTFCLLFILQSWASDATGSIATDLAPASAAAPAVATPDSKAAPALRTTPEDPKSSVGGWYVIMFMYSQCVFRVGVSIIFALFVLFVVTMIFRGRNTKGLPNTIRGVIGKVSGLSTDVDPYVVVSSMGEMSHRTDCLMRPGEVGTFDEAFTWSVSPTDISRFRSVGKIKFEVLNLKGSTYAVSDPSLGAVEIPISELYTEGQVERMESLRLRTKKGVVINVKIGVYAEHHFFQALNRFVQSWKLRQKEISFWTRIFSVFLVAILLSLGLHYLENSDWKTLGICDIVVGSVIGAVLLPHVLHWMGITFMDPIRMESLFGGFSLYVSSASTMIAIWKYFGPTDPALVIGHFLLIAALGFSALLYLAADLKGEPGASCLGRAFGNMFGCCFGGSRMSMVRHAL